MDVETKIGTGFKGPPILERFSLKEIFSIFLDLDHENIPEKISPSCFVREMQMSTEQRYKKLVNPLRKLNFEKELCQAEIYFKINPNIVVFQKCQIGETYNIRLSVCNSSKILTPLRMTCENSPYFKVNYTSPKVITSLAPGMSVYFDVKFTPEEQRDYKHQITFLTEKTSFIVPVYAIGPRPLLDFPDAVHFPKTYVKVPAIKMLMVSNIGEVAAVFSLTAECPFTVQPSKYALAVGEVMQVNISFDSIKTGNYAGSLIINFVTGEKLVTSLHGMAENANIMLSKETVHIEDTYMGFKRQTTLTLHNNSDHIVHFKWGKYQSREEEGLQMDKIYQDEVKALDCEEFLFSSHNFSLIPLTGEVWPNAFVEVTIVFNPDEAKDFQTKSYCDVTGLEDRIPLIITGRGLGPLIELNLASLDMSLIYLCSVHSYEGDIPGTIVFIEKPLVFGGKVECTPRSYMLVPGDYKVFVLNFSSAKEGDFFEDICFRIEESQEVVSFVMNIAMHITCTVDSLESNGPMPAFGPVITRQR
uniref:HYDIN/VesB/CFA65-like Ig-like domain-containing protein n=1 Tax=Timema cristinae TaxID=61476 RepID=A0A7R9CGB6_TIMCR|nr:unnamed protein product [Timema cristinae]